MRCIGYATEPAPKKPRVKKVLTDAEKDEAAVKRDVNKLLKENKKEWESTLKPWVGSKSTRWPVGTLVRLSFFFWNGVASDVSDPTRQCTRVMVTSPHVFSTRQYPSSPALLSPSTEGLLTDRSRAAHAPTRKYRELPKVLLRP
jgi:hypothetical protein